MALGEPGGGDLGGVDFGVSGRRMARPLGQDDFGKRFVTTDGTDGNGWEEGERKFLLLRNAEGGAYMFWCPGCQCGRAYYVDKPSPVWCSVCKAGWHEPPCAGASRMGPYQWTFNGDMEKPTFRASLLMFGHEAQTPFKSSPRCHLFVTDGRIEYCADCGHRLAGQTVSMEPFEPQRTQGTQRELSFHP